MRNVERKQLALQLTNSLVVSDNAITGSILHGLGHFSSLTSAKIQTGKYHDEFSLYGKLEKKKVHARYSYYRKPGSRAEMGKHPKLISQALAEVLKTNPTAVIHREVNVEAIGTRPDAIVLVNLNGRGRCFILEVNCHETDEYLINKLHKWQLWNNALPFLSNLFNVKIPGFDFVSTQGVPGAFVLDEYLEGLK